MASTKYRVEDPKRLISDKIYPEVVQQKIEIL